RQLTLIAHRSFFPSATSGRDLVLVDIRQDKDVVVLQARFDVLRMQRLRCEAVLIEQPARPAFVERAAPRVVNRDARLRIVRVLYDDGLLFGFDVGYAMAGGDAGRYTFHGDAHRQRQGPRGY